MLCFLFQIFTLRAGCRLVSLTGCTGWLRSDRYWFSVSFIGCTVYLLLAGLLNWQHWLAYVPDVATDMMAGLLNWLHWLSMSLVARKKGLGHWSP